MDFFDNAVNKTREVIDVACKKTGEVVSTQKQRFDVASLESKRAKDFETLGMMYFDIIKDTEIENASIRELVASIKQKNESIDELNREIMNAKNKRLCPACGAYIDNSSVYCNICGAKVIIESEKE